jgi:hypothetical protein
MTQIYDLSWLHSHRAPRCHCDHCYHHEHRYCQLITAQKQARDAARREIISNVQSAFEQYYAETGSYQYRVQVRPLKEGVPTDPKGTALTWNLDAAAYCVCATLESGTGNAGAPGASTTCSWTGTTHYCATNKQ